MSIYKNIPNVLTIGRIVLIPFFLNFLVYGYTKYAIVTFVVAALSDAADGAVARYTDARTELGAALDPMADKMLAVTAFVALSIQGYVPLWLTLCVVFRDAVIVSGSFALYFMGHRVKVRPSITGKLSTVFQSSLIVAALAGVLYRTELAVVSWLTWFTLLFTVASGIQYVMRGIRIVTGREDAASPG